MARSSTRSSGFRPRSFSTVAAAALAALVVTGVALAPSATAASVDRATFWRAFSAQTKPFTDPSARWAVESTVRMTWAAPDLGDPLVVRMWQRQNPDGAEQFRATGGPIGDARGVCSAAGACWLSTDGGATWMTGRKPRGDATALGEQYASYDPVFWELSDLPDGASYDVDGEKHTIRVDDDSSITVTFGQRRVVVSGELRDDDSRVTVAATHELVAPRPIRPPR